MLTVTEQAASMIREIFDHADLPRGAGLSIADRRDHPALAIAVTDEPSPEDLIVAERAVADFLAPSAPEQPGESFGHSNPGG